MGSWPQTEDRIISENTTVWQSSGNQEGEYTQATVNAIADPLGVALVDPSAVAVVDTGVAFTPISSTTWNMDPGL